MARSVKRRAPLWARIGVTAGCLLLVPAGGALAAKQAVPAASAGVPAGPLNILLAGIDPRGSHVTPLSDTIMVVHIPADRDRAYLFSLPRDLVVQIPADPRSGTETQRAKINAAMGLGSRVGNGVYDPAQGYDLLARTVGEVTGINPFDAGAVINFGGFRKMVEALGGVRMVIDQDVVSEQLKPDGTPRDRLPECRDGHPCLRPYTGPQKVYPKSDKPVRLQAWEALDYVRQRYGLPRSDYDRQRHQQQFVKAMAKQLSKDPGRLPQVLGAAGDSLTLVGGHSVADWAPALKDLNPRRTTAIGLPGEALFEDGTYRGEQFPPQVYSFFAAVAEDRVAQFLLDHPGLVSIDG